MKLLLKCYFVGSAFGELMFSKTQIKCENDLKPALFISLLQPSSFYKQKKYFTENS